MSKSQSFLISYRELLLFHDLVDGPQNEFLLETRDRSHHRMESARFSKTALFKNGEIL
jgi:hypothetical protein